MDSNHRPADYESPQAMFAGIRRCSEHMYFLGFLSVDEVDGPPVSLALAVNDEGSQPAAVGCQVGEGWPDSRAAHPASQAKSNRQPTD